MPIFEAEYRAGDVVIVPFPFTDRLAEKRRPAVVVSTEALGEAGLLWVVMITTAKRTIENFDIAVRDLTSAGLRTPCVVRPTKIASIEMERIVRRAGRLTKAELFDVLAMVRGFVAVEYTGKNQ